MFFRNNKAGKDYLINSIHMVLDELEFLGVDQSQWHSYRCKECNWSGYSGPVCIKGPNRGKLACPDCESINIENLRQK